MSFLFKYILLIMLLQLPQFFPFTPHLPRTPLRLSILKLCYSSFTIESYEVLVYFTCNPIIRYTVCKYASHFSGCLFISLMFSFAVHELINLM